VGVYDNSVSVSGLKGLRMSALLLSIFGRLREYVGNRRRGSRRSTRYPVRLDVSLELIDAKTGEAVSGASRINGHTQDLNEESLTLIVPVIRVGERYLTAMDTHLLLTLQLPTGPAEIRVAAARFNQLLERDAGCGYLIGARIVVVSKIDYSSYLAYMRRLAHGDRRQGFPAEIRAAEELVTARESTRAWETVTPDSLDVAFKAFKASGGREK
jgi:hypothetical protein